MDQNKSAMPHFSRKPKCVSNAEADLMKMHVTAGRVTGRAVHEYVYTNNLAHDANTTVTIVHKCV